MFLQFLIAFAIAVVSAATAKAADPFDANKFPFDQPDLKFPDKPRPVGPDLTMMFKPIGDGPFPALVIMPTCSGHTVSMHAFDWAHRARFQGYAVLVVDPLTPRGVSLNCESPSPVRAARVLKDAFDAANHLRRQSFVDPTRVGLMGFSQGAMVALAASGSTYSRRTAPSRRSEASSPHIPFVFSKIYRCQGLLHGRFSVRSGENRRADIGGHGRPRQRGHGYNSSGL